MRCKNNRDCYKVIEREKKHAPDFVSHVEPIIESKVLKALKSGRSAHVFNYLKAIGPGIGFLINYGTPKLQ